MKTHRIPTRTIAMTGMLSAVSTVLMFFSFSVPLMPSFIKLDFSELPALIAAFSMGPISGAVVPGEKPHQHAVFHHRLRGRIRQFPAGDLLRHPGRRDLSLQKIARRRADWRHRRRAGHGGRERARQLLYHLSRVFAVHAHGRDPGYVPRDQPQVETLWDALVWFNMPFTFIKALCSAVITFVIYKPLSR